MIGTSINTEHALMVKALVKNPEKVQEELTPFKCDLMHAAIGISGEAGELLDAIKKHIIYNRLIDYDNIREELGDLEFYMEQLRSRLGMSREEILAANIKKLAERYATSQYSDQQAHERKDKSTTEFVPP